jgi:plasmid maintenance system antidote protein VapI
MGTILSTSERRRIYVTPYVTHRLRSELEKAGRGAAAALARALPTSRPTISDLLAGNVNVGEDVEEKLARYWGFSSVPELHVTAERWCKEYDAKLDTKPDAGRQRALTGRADAISVAKRWGFDESAIEGALRDAPAAAATKPARWWFELILQQQRLIEMMAESSPKAETAAKDTKTQRVAHRLSTQAGLSPVAKKVTKERRK